MVTSPPLEQELDLRKVVVRVGGVEIQNRAGPDMGGATGMAPEEQYGDPRIRDVAGTFVGWLREPDVVDIGASGVISVQLGSEAARILSGFAESHQVVDVVFESNGSGLGFKTQTLQFAKISASPISISPTGVRMFMFVGWGYDEVPEDAPST